ncbi:MAG: hypothetical protein U0401_19910 [Anaerolineae bacterium]
MAWLRTNWRWAALNLSGVSILTFIVSQGVRTGMTLIPSTLWAGGGKWAIRFLLLCLSITPYKPILLAHRGQPAQTGRLVGFRICRCACAGLSQKRRWEWLAWPPPALSRPRPVGLVDPDGVGLTSPEAMVAAEENWKLLHRLVYLAYTVQGGDAILSTGMSKKVLIHDPWHRTGRFIWWCWLFYWRCGSRR